MKKQLFLLYGVVCYALFFVSFLYAYAFLANLSFIPKSIDSGEVGGMTMAILINIGLLGIFAVQHSVMARPAFKKQWTKFVPEPIERSTYTVLSALLLYLIFWQWQPMPEAVWDFAGSPVGYVLWAVFLSGMLLVLYSTFLIDHFDLFGLRQVVLYWQGKEYTHKPFKTPSLYKHMRHPLYLGWFLTFWGTPTMSQGHLLFAVVTTVYILLAIQIEERDLVGFFGDDYAQYQKRTSMVLPIPKKRS